MPRENNIERYGRPIFLRLTSKHASYDDVNGEYTFDLNGVSALKAIRRIVLYQIDLFNLQTNINVNNNTIKIDGTNYVIPVGQYNASDFVNAFNTAILASGLTFAINADTVRLDITNTTGVDIEINESPLIDYIGILTTSFTVPASSTVTTDTSFDLSGLNEILIDSQILYPHSMVLSNLKLNSNNSYLKFANYSPSIPVAIGYKQRQVYQPSHHESTAFNYQSREDMSIVKIRLLDGKNEKPIDNMNAPWSIVFKLYRDFD